MSKDDFFNRILLNDMVIDIRLVGDRFQNGIPKITIQSFEFCIIS